MDTSIYNYMIKWDIDTNDDSADNKIDYVLIDADKLTSPFRCMPYYATSIDKIYPNFKSILIKNKKIKTFYHNQKSYDIVIYDDDTVQQDEGSGRSKIGKLIKINNLPNTKNDTIDDFSDEKNDAVNIHNTDNNKGNLQFSFKYLVLSVIIVMFIIAYFIKY